MSTHRGTTGRTDDEPNAPDTHQLAAELGVDAELLARFEDEHPNPTAPIVIGWAHSRGELRCHPEQLRPDVEAWLDTRARCTDSEPVDVPDDVRLRWNREDTAGGDD
jgi:hypothetical protein